MMILYDNKATFINDHMAFLKTDVILNQLMMGLLLKQDVEPTFMMALQATDQRLLGMVAGKHMILASDAKDPEIFKTFLSALDEVDYPGIIGPKKICEMFADAYQERFGKPMIKTMDQRIYLCKKVHHEFKDIGTIRYAKHSDLKTVAAWTYAFEMMIEQHADMERIHALLEKKIADHTLYVLEVNGRLVSMAARSRPLETSESVGLVYTPEDERKKGYATHLVSAVTKDIINDGRVATLYTDLSNPTSNDIYMKIGYEPHGDSVVYQKP